MADRIKPKNLTAQFLHQARGNPPSTLPIAAISNCFPGLESDFRNVWKNVFEGIELHESGLVEDGHLVVGVASGGAAEAAGVVVFARLVAVDDRPVEATSVTRDGPRPTPHALEFGNSLAEVFPKAGQVVKCTFVAPETSARVDAMLRVRPLFEGAALSEALGEPGALTQSLCSPWQADYRECGCFYWAASRPDYVNIVEENGEARGHDWMQKDRSAGAPYRPDASNRYSSPDHFTYDDLYSGWEQTLKFVVEGNDDE